VARRLGGSMQVGDLVKYRFTGKMGIIVKSKQHVLRPLTLLYVEWINNEDNGWISAMNLEVIA
jgi:hypothetical protein